MARTWLTDETISWGSPTDWDNAVSESGDISHPGGQLELLIGKESWETGNIGDEAYSLTPWNGNGQGIIDDTRVLDGSVSAYANSPTDGVTFFAYNNYVSGTYDNQTITWAYNETTNQTGSDLTFLNENGNYICRMGSCNPERVFFHGNGVTEHGSPSPNYDVWYEFQCELDFPNQQVTFRWRDRSGNGNANIDDGPYPFENSSESLERIELDGSGYSTPNSGATGNNIDSWHDRIWGVFKSGSVTTATKSFSSATKPDLQYLNYKLNGQEIIVDIIGSPGTASEEIQTANLNGEKKRDLTWTNAHSDFRVKVALNSISRTAAPRFDNVELVGNRTYKVKSNERFSLTRK